MFLFKIIMKSSFLQNIRYKPCNTAFKTNQIPAPTHLFDTLTALSTQNGKPKFSHLFT